MSTTTRAALRALGRVVLTLVIVAVAVFAGTRIWAYYMNEPWTRDGRVRADIVQVTPDVSGLVSQVLVHDNQHVTRGQVLFRVDAERFRLALMQAEAVVKSRLAAVQEAAREAARYQSLTNTEVSQEKQQQTTAIAQQAAAAYEQALADRGVAQLNLDRANVTAPVDGIITNFDLQRGDYVTAGRPVTALVDTASLHIDGYFEETKLPRIQVGARAYVQLMGETSWLPGHVQSIAGAIADRERSSNNDLLADVNPTFNWVRLAQRIPVRIVLEDPPADVRLIPGRTATVRIGRSERDRLKPAPEGVNHAFESGS
ncbi:HlyD family secretion protein [Rhodopila sp.]|jgi:multidrug resistance efflux pump|uniref:HlyD family secretion protein n=1 Tax=Rhodopila sp. TaxID=2480087 RepID=UPI002C83EA2F|nr:HlyD family secretion protein [Rhodopila sp.]HVZ07180.1 HlyD family secretion protein [Rhodopila sp.]